MKTVTEILEAIDALIVKMQDKGVSQPDAYESNSMHSSPVVIDVGGESHALIITIDGEQYAVPAKRLSLETATIAPVYSSTSGDGYSSVRPDSGTEVSAPCDCSSPTPVIPAVSTERYY